eukprot:GHRQ01023102.1.p1 GENE.GHRQ01023102.1~~GHRQ01023102.1.p1  ORF type:complete len:309 (+),score=77.59 GHRQ01023102.1:245-1171(+)
MQQVDPATREPEKARDQKYALDHIFGPKQSTRAIYEETTQGLIKKLVNGFNSTVFAYGQTSSGKTHTMRGTADEPGIIPMAVQEVFGLIESLQDREFLLRVSYMEVRCSDSAAVVRACNLEARAMQQKRHSSFGRGGTSSSCSCSMTNSAFQGTQPCRLLADFRAPTAVASFSFLCVCLLQLYNEDINDLLAPENLKLPIHESKENGVYVAGLREDIVVSPEQVLELLREGEANRHIGATKMNEGSSRSHTVFRMVKRRGYGQEQAVPTNDSSAYCSRAGVVFSFSMALSLWVMAALRAFKLGLQQLH